MPLQARDKNFRIRIDNLLGEQRRIVLASENMIRSHLVLSVFVLSGFGVLSQAADHVVYEGGEGPGKGKHVVLLAGDEEYRSEESLPMLGQVLSQRHGFKSTVCFSVNDAGEIDPKAGRSLSHPEALDTADAIVMLLRFRYWDDETMKRFQAALDRGVPLIALRTSTHAFNPVKEGPWGSWAWDAPGGGWGKKVLGETWVSHWGKHKFEATRSVVEPGTEMSELLRGVGEIFGDSDVYEAHPPSDVNVLLRGQVVDGMTPESGPATLTKKTAKGVEQAVNEPMMPIAWTRELKNEAGTTNRILCTTMGAATDLVDEDLRRLVVNGVFWGLGLEVPEKAEVSVVSPYEPSKYGFDGFKVGVKPEVFELKE